MPSSDGHALPLNRVDYPELWPGITLSYEAVSGGIVRSSYLLEPGADVGRIRLRSWEPFGNLMPVDFDIQLSNTNVDADFTTARSVTNFTAPASPADWFTARF